MVLLESIPGELRLVLSGRVMSVRGPWLVELLLVVVVVVWVSAAQAANNKRPDARQIAVIGFMPRFYQDPRLEARLRGPLCRRLS